MLSSYLSLLLLLSPFTLAAATVVITPISPVAQAPSLETSSPFEPYPSSLKNWEIFYCGDPRKPESQVHNLIVLLTRMESHLKALIADARLGMSSTHGYAPFFKTARNIRRVTAQYQTILDGNPIIVSEERGKQLGTRTPPPRFFCVNEENDRLKALSDACKKAPEEPILVQQGMEVLLVCPKFWSVPQFVDPALAAFHCPKMVNGKFQEGDMSLARATVYANLVHQLVRTYDRGMDPKNPQEEVPSMQDAVEMSSRESMNSAINFGYYAGAVAMGCTEFPRILGRNDELRS
ncbi:MAG: hypothetical protein Q9209_005290 [Squamulea sp. 1 TL-2023]